MCGIVGLHLRTPELYPRLGELLTGMLCEMGDRGSDSAGVAVYGDPTWSPPGRGCVSVLDVDRDAPTTRRRHALGVRVEAVTRRCDLPAVGRDVVGDTARRRQGGVSRRR